MVGGPGRMAAREVAVLVVTVEDPHIGGTQDGVQKPQ